MKINQALERIFGFRLADNDQIPSYIAKISSLGKFDSPKQISVTSLLLTRLAALEAQVEVLRASLEESKGVVVNTTSFEPGIKVSMFENGVPCPECAFIAKSAFGLKGHMKKHK